MPREETNIVFIMADQLSAGSIGCYGSGVESSPCLDGLAGSGVRFDRLYAHVPVCAPNRATIFTGRSSDVHGVATNNLVLTTDDPTFGHILQRNGYRVGGFGKFHLTPMQQTLPEDFAYLGFDESVPTEDPKLGPWLDWVEAEHPEHYETALAVSWPMQWAGEYGRDGRDLLPAMAAAREKILAPRRSASEWQLMYESPLPAELHQTTWITNLSLDFIRRHRREDADRPFFCFTSYVDPHDPYDPPAPYSTMFDPREMPEPRPMTWPQEGCTILERSRDFPDWRKVSGNVELTKKLRALYHGSVRFIDDQIARIVALLEELGLWDNTILVFTTDHGDMIGDHGLISKGVKHYDMGIRCPLIVAGAGVERGARDRLTSSLDFLPTFCDWAAVEARPPLEGRSFAAACSGSPPQDDGWREVTVQAPPSRHEGTVRSIVTEDGWRFSIYDEDGQGQMFDLNEDPDEQRNLYHDPAWTAKRLELHERLTRAYMQPAVTHQYRNLPRRNGQRLLLGRGFGPMEPTF
jgi:arylsulfatase